MTDKKPIRPDGIYTPVVPPYVPPRQKIERGTANTINRAEPREKLLNVAGYGEVLPVLYGEDRIGGVFIAGPVVKSNFYICAIAWSATNEHGIEGVQQVVINGSTATISGATITHYKGTQDTVDATLAAAFTGFNQKYKGIAYTVFKIPAAGVNGVPRIEAVVRGMKIKDPRTDVVSWTENPALHMYDFVTNDKYGAGMTVRGLAECADYCDSIYKTLPRCRAAIYINEAHDLSVQLDMFAAYAECLWSYEGSGVFIVPDAVVALGSITDISISSITIGTMRLGGVDASNVPTRVTVTHTTPSAVYSDPWPQNSVYYDAAGVTTGELDVINSDVRLIGIHRDLEARRKCLLRLKRLSVPARISFQMQGDGIAIQRGDVKRLPDMLGLGPDYLVRIMSNELVSYGEYQMTAEPYSEAMYDVDVSPSDSGIAIPLGGIIAYFGDSTPDGFSSFTAAGNRLLKGCLVGNSGEYNHPDFVTSGNTQASIIHYHSGTAATAHGSKDDSGYYAGNETVAGHAHTFTTTVSMGESPRRSGLKLIVANTPSAIPIGGAVFARSVITSGQLALMSRHNGLMISAGDGLEIEGSGRTDRCSATLSAATTGAAGAHGHGQEGLQYFPPFRADIAEKVPDHTHSIMPNAEVACLFNAHRIAMYIAQVTASVPDRAVIGFTGSVIPTGWQVCAQLVDRFALLSIYGVGFDDVINGLPQGYGKTDSHTHKHSIIKTPANVGGNLIGEPVNSGTESHTHDHTVIFYIGHEAQPNHYKIVFIEYIGE